MRKTERYYSYSAGNSRLIEFAKRKTVAWMYRDGNTFIVVYIT